MQDLSAMSDTGQVGTRPTMCRLPDNPPTLRGGHAGVA